MTDPEVKDDNAVRVYVPTDVRPEMLDGPEAQALRDELDEARAQLAALREFGTREQAGWDTASTTLTRKARRAEEACAVALARLTVAEGLLGECVADDGGLYDLGLRAGRAGPIDAETDECIAAADAIEDRVRAHLAPRPEPAKGCPHGVGSRSLCAPCRFEDEREPAKRGTP